MLECDGLKVDDAEQARNSKISKNELDVKKCEKNEFGNESCLGASACLGRAEMSRGARDSRMRRVIDLKKIISLFFFL